MAREAGFILDILEQGFLLRVTGIEEDLKAFEALVRADERALAAQPAPDHIPDVTKMVAAQRQWVGLTDEERMEIYNKPLTIASCIGATEAKLKEKNT